MKNQFISSSFFQFFSRIFDIMLLNFLFLICCLPIVTIGVSTAAMFSVTLKLNRNQESYVIKDFFYAFRHNFKQGIILHLLLILLTIIIFIDLYVMWNILEFGILYKWIFGLLVIFSCLVLFASFYIYPLLAQFHNTVKGYIRSAITLSLCSC